MQRESHIKSRLWIFAVCLLHMVNSTSTVIADDSAAPGGITALHQAVHQDDLKAVKSLLQNGADVTAENRYGVSPLSTACQNGNAAIVELLLEAGADPNSKLPGGETALMTAARTGKLGPVNILLKYKAEVDARERKGQTALMWAAAAGHTAVVDALLQAGADWQAKLKSGFTPLFFAVREGKQEVVFRLLAAGADVNGVMLPEKKTGKGPAAGTSPLILAAENGHYDLALALLRAGANPNDQRSGYAVLHAMTWIRKPIRGDGDPSPVGSGKLSSLGFVRELIENGADVNLRHKEKKNWGGRLNKTDATAFLLAAETADLPLLRLLLELGADPHLINVENCTPLLAAAGVGVIGNGDEAAGTEAESIETIKWLMKLGADINAVDKNGQTAMHGAAYKSYTKMVQFLDDNGADIEVWNRKNRFGVTPIRIAEGHRPGNFRPSPKTLAVLQKVMQATSAKNPAEQQLEVQRDIEYAQVDGHRLLLDLYLPPNIKNPPLVVWVHGGAWRKGSKESMPLRFLLKHGYAIASINYRLSPVAKFPAQMHDCKAAIRFLRTEQTKRGYNALRIGIAGSSAGGHLAALVGVTNGHVELEGQVGEHLDFSSDVQAIVDYYGPTNFMTILKQSTPHGLGVRVPALDLLLGGQPKEQKELAMLASPVSHVHEQAPPLLMFHGDQDPQVPINQSHELHGAYQQQKLDSTLVVIHGGAHGGRQFFDQRRNVLVREFLDRHLKAKAALP